MENEVILQIDKLTKIYPGGVLANYEISFDLRKGEIHALAGENGAGKSTLMKCLFGLEEITSGRILLNGEEVRFSSSQDAIRHGIGMVQQSTMLVPSLTVAENLTLGMEPSKGPFIDGKKAVEETLAISKKYNLNVDAQKKVRDISIGMKQKLEILKTMYRGARIIILDEPTAVLTPQETDELFTQLVNLKQEGYTIIFISHKLGEVKQICDRLTVLKAGKSIGTYSVADVSVQDISRLMVGRDVVIDYNQAPCEPGEIIFEARKLNYHDKFGTHKLKDVSFSLRRGEVLGIAGIEGNGQLEAMNIITGNLSAESGEIFFKGQTIANHSVQAVRDAGMAHISEDRAYNGSAPELSVRDNLTATFLRNFSGPLGLLNNRKIDTFSTKAVQDYQIVASSLDTSIKSLSGGNIQKAIVAREFESDADMIVLNQPTRGVDVGAMEFIHKKILEMRSKKKALLLVSADLTELTALSDRIIVICEGRVVGVVNDVKNTTEEELGLYMLGLKRDDQEKLATA